MPTAIRAREITQPFPGAPTPRADGRDRAARPEPSTSETSAADAIHAGGSVPPELPGAASSELREMIARAAARAGL